MKSSTPFSFVRALAGSSSLYRGCIGETLGSSPLEPRGGDCGGLGGGGFVASRSLIGALPFGGVASVGVWGAGRLLLPLLLLSHRRLVWGGGVS